MPVKGTLFRSLGYNFALVPSGVRLIAVPEPEANSLSEHRDNLAVLVAEVNASTGERRGKLIKDALVYAGAFGLPEPDLPPY